ncbi:MAG: LPXTG cell wall anchor domain-containing protein [Acutalibacteraceae bacterium]|nr:LPXTG cell wall anchor domain-containing protein [Acutalibacteraceae bacterium]
MKKLSVFISFVCSFIFIVMSAVNCFAFDVNTVSTGDSTTIIVVALGILMIIAIIAIILMSRKKK